MKRDPIWRRYRDLLGRNPVADADEEVRIHLEMREQEARRSGMTADQARDAARTRFGDVAGITTELRRIDGSRERRRVRGEWWSDFRQDVKVACRTLAHARVFALTAIGTIAIAIAANTTVFSFVDSLLFERLPYAKTDELVVIRGVSGTVGEALAIRERTRSLADLAIYRTRSITLNDDHDAVRIDGSSITPNLLPMLGVKPLVGAAFPPSASDPGNGQAIMLSYGLWQRRYGAARDVVGRRLIVDGTSYTVVGIMPPEFHFPTARAEFWVPLTIDRTNIAEWGSGGGWDVARLRRGVSVQSAQRELTTVVTGMRHLNPLWDPGADYGKHVDLLPFRQHLVGTVRSAALLLWACAGVVLLVACVNLANLLLARSSARDRELSIRAALGGGRARLVRQLLTESLVIAVLGGLASLVLTAVGTRAIAAAAPSDFPHLGDTGMRGSVYLFSTFLTLGATLAFGLLPALRATAPRTTARAIRLGRSETAGVEHTRVFAFLMAGEVALAVVLAIAGGLLSRSFIAMRDLSPGFRTARIIVAQVNPPPATFVAGSSVTSLYDEILRRASALPGVTNVAAVDRLPIVNPVYGIALRIEGQFEDVHHFVPWIPHFQVVTPGYLDTFGIPVLRGRGLTSLDGENAQPVALVSQAVAKKYWPGDDAIGKQIGYPFASPWLTIVGIVPDVRLDSLRDTSTMAIYVPVAQRFSARFGGGASPSLSIAIRATGDPDVIQRAIRGMVASVDRRVAVSRISTMDDVMAGSLAKPRFTTELVGAFAIIALVLGGVGVYGVMSYLVSQRKHEMGVRAALGATAGDIVALVLRRTVGLAGAGAAVGVVVALLVTRSLHAMLFQVSPNDPLTFVAVPLVFVGVSVIASAAPARRAARCDPVGALRGE